MNGTISIFQFYSSLKTWPGTKAAMVLFTRHVETQEAYGALSASTYLPTSFG